MTQVPREPSFEEALAKLEQVVSRLEEGSVPLEEAIRLFEEGMGQSALCRRLLDEAERKVEVLLRRPDGTAAVEERDAERILPGGSAT
jgi:exodeoxyribonuclease VII small subunit